MSPVSFDPNNYEAQFQAVQDAQKDTVDALRSLADEIDDVEKANRMREAATELEQLMNAMSQLPDLVSPSCGWGSDLGANWVPILTPGSELAAFFVEYGKEEHKNMKSQIRSRGESNAQNLESQAKKMEETAKEVFIFAAAAGAVSIAAGITSGFLGGVGGMGKMDTNVMNTASTATSGLNQGIGGILNAWGQQVQSLGNADIKRLEAQLERARTSLELTKQTDESMRQLISKALETMNNLQANMNQTRAKILG